MAGLLALLVPAAAVRGQERAVGSPSASGYTSGWSLDRRPIVPVTDYAASAYYGGRLSSLAPPIFMTTLSTPGIYGAYDYGTGGLTLTREPWFYPVLDDRERIPAVTTTITPLRDLYTPAGAPTLYAGPPSVTPRVPGSATVRTLPEQVLTARALATTPRPELAARIVVRLPEDARLEFQGTTVPQLGRIRKFETPLLVPGKKYLYDVRASWSEEGKPVVRQRQVAVYGGERTDVDFLDGTEQHNVRELRAQPVQPPVLSPRADVVPRVTPPPAPGQKPAQVPPMQPTLPPNRQ
jgi:uncharacterized protein (TIGR03000 family)